MFKFNKYIEFGLTKEMKNWRKNVLWEETEGRESILEDYGLQIFGELMKSFSENKS